MRKIVNDKEIVLGVCYYPEHWPEEMWEQDLDRMLEMGLKVVRIAEFAWNKIEPREGEFVFDFFDRFLDLAYKKGMQVIFCTPTAAPPVWLTHKYPEVLNVSRTGVRYEHGERRHYNYNSPVYQEKTRIIVEQSASHYAPHPAVIGWQIDNELNCGIDEFYTESDTMAFRQFLKEKYHTLENLNEAWGTMFWNQTYLDWDEVKVPGPVPCNNINCHEMMDYIRFVSWSARRYCHLQSEILRKYLKPDDFITTNGRFGKLDNHKMTDESLDFFMYDSYPNFAYFPGMYDPAPDALRDRWNSKNLTEIRSISGNFGIMEQQSGANTLLAPTPKPGQMTLWTLQSIAHGADFVSYFRWHTCLFGVELAWHGILDHSGRDNRRVREVKEIFGKVRKLNNIAGSRYEAKAAVLKDYDNEWDSWNNFLTVDSDDHIYEAAQRTHTPLNYVYLYDGGTTEPLSRYPVVFYPHGMMMSGKRAKILESYVAQGGTLVLGCHSAYRDLCGHGVMEKLPGVLKNLTGIDIPEYTPVTPGDAPAFIRWGEDRLEAVCMHDQIQIEPGHEKTAQILGYYENTCYDDMGGLSVNQFGEGKVYYWGAGFTVETAAVFLKKLNAASPYEDTVSLPESCEIAVREKDGRRYYFILNYQREQVCITIHKEMKDLYSGDQIRGEVCLEPYGTMVLTD